MTEIHNQLRTMYKDLGLGEQILQVYAEKAHKTGKKDNELVEELKSYGGELKIYQSFADQNRTLKKELEDLKKKKTEEPKPQDPKTEEPKEDIPAWAKALMESNKNLSDSLEKMRQEKISASNEEKLTAKLKELGVNENFYKGRLKSDFENEESINAYAVQIKADEDTLLQSLNIQKIKEQEPPKFGANVKENEVSPEVKEFIELKNKK